MNMTTDEAIKYITDFEKNLYDACVIKETIANNELMRTLEAFDFAIKELKHDRWIPCSERMPMENGTYLVTVHEWSDDKDDFPDHDYHKVMRMRFLIPDGWKVPIHSPEWINKVMHEDVLAWKIMPEPYKEQQNED